MPAVDAVVSNTSLWRRIIIPPLLFVAMVLTFVVAVNVSRGGELGSSSRAIDDGAGTSTNGIAVVVPANTTCPSWSVELNENGGVVASRGLVALVWWRWLISYLLSESIAYLTLYEENNAVMIVGLYLVHCGLSPFTWLFFTAAPLFTRRREQPAYFMVSPVHRFRLAILPHQIESHTKINEFVRDLPYYKWCRLVAALDTLITQPLSLLLAYTFFTCGNNGFAAIIGVTTSAISFMIAFIVDIVIPTFKAFANSCTWCQGQSTVKVPDRI